MTRRQNKNLLCAGGAATLATLHRRCTVFSMKYKNNTPGRRPANINWGIHVGLSQTSIGASFTKVLCSMNTPPASVSDMQKSANTNIKVIMEENVKDMKLRCQELRSLNILSGKNPASVNVEADGCYNNALYSGVDKTPSQNTSYISGCRK